MKTQTKQLATAEQITILSRKIDDFVNGKKYNLYKGSELQVEIETDLCKVYPGRGWNFCYRIFAPAVMEPISAFNLAVSEPDGGFRSEAEAAQRAVHGAISMLSRRRSEHLPSPRLSDSLNETISKEFSEAEAILSSFLCHDTEVESQD